MQITSDYNKYGKKSLKLKIKKPNMVLRVRKPNTKFRIMRPKIRIKYSTLDFLHNLKNFFISFYKNYFYLILTLFLMISIFMFSNQTANISSETSNRLNDILSNFVLFRNLFLIIPIRKIAHFSLFFCLYFSVYEMINNWDLMFSKLNCYSLSLIITFIYACFDEFHQIFITGRSASILDIFIDTSGALVCMLLILSIRFLKNYIYFKKGKAT